MQPTPELRFLLACARLRMEERDREVVRDCLAGSIEWDRVMQLARWHGVRPLLDRHLALAGGEAVPRKVSVESWAAAQAIARRNLVMHAELARVLAALDGAGIRALPYKGPTLALLAYGDVGLREFCDLDLLLARHQARRAADVLCAAGYVREYELAPHIEAAFVASSTQYHLALRSADGVLVELHWKTDPQFPVERLEDPQWWASTHAVHGMATLPGEDLLLVLFLHGAKHAWWRLAWLVDVAELLRIGGYDWEHIAMRARAMGVSRSVGAGLRLAADLLGAPLPPAARALADRADVQAAAKRVAAILLAPQPREPGTWEGLSILADLHERRGDFIRAVFRSVCSPSLVEWTRWPLPAPLFFAYPVLRLGRLAAKYVRRGIERAFRGRKLQT